MAKENPKKQRNKYLALSGIGIQMGVTIYLFAYFGKWLDQKYQNEKQIYTLIFVLFAVIVSIYSLIKQLDSINKRD